ncbi:MAG: hypothetical protein JOZ41_17055 [Chloroflexi bacterium]|nr:hypothetical protein [Chloroflexota bacterium]
MTDSAEWIENVSPWRYGLRWEEPWTARATEQMRERILLGPPGAVRQRSG